MQDTSLADGISSDTIIPENQIVTGDSTATGSGDSVNSSPDSDLVPPNPSTPSSSSSDLLPLSETQLLLKGCFLKGTAFMLGCVVYAGPECKIALNAQKPKQRLSTLDRRMNIAVFILFMALFVFVIVTSILNFTLNVC